MTGALSLESIALAQLARLLPDAADPVPAARLLLARQAELPTGGAAAALQQLRAEPQPEDGPLLALAAGLDLSDVELLATALAAAVELRPLVGAAVQHLQAPSPQTRPTLGLLAEAFADLCGHSVVPVLAAGPAVASGLLELGEEGAPLVERTLRVPTSLVLALGGGPLQLRGGRLLDRRPLLPPSLADLARRHAALLGRGRRRALILRSSAAADALALAASIAAELGTGALALAPGMPVPAGLGPLCRLRGVLPVLQPDLVPGERRELAWPVGLPGPLLVVAGPDGSLELPDVPTLELRLPLPLVSEREALWAGAVGDPGLARRLASEQRQGSSRINAIAGRARLLAELAGLPQPGPEEVRRAAWDSIAGLDSLAQPVRAEVEAGAFVASPELEAELDLLLARCRARDRLARGLGPALRSRYGPGVRALLTGPSGTGKTLATLRLADALGLPLYRVDLAAVTSKFIGETERNLALLLARAEASEIVLLFDEADALFGRRTDIRDSNDRFANAQTNYLLQRIESYEGIVLLTANSRTRFDPAFTRRLDAVIELEPPGPAERRVLWLAHLGPEHCLSEAALNRLAALPDLAGGHIRGAVLTAAALAAANGHRPGLPDLARGAAAEYRKLGRSGPPELAGLVAAMPS